MLIFKIINILVLFLAFFCKDIYTQDSNLLSLHFGTNIGLLKHNHHSRPHGFAGFSSAITYSIRPKIQFRLFSINHLGFTPIHQLYVYDSILSAQSFYTSTSFSLHFLHKIFHINKNNGFFYYFFGPNAGLASLRFKRATITKGHLAPYHKVTTTFYGFDLGMGYNFKNIYNLELIYQQMRGNVYDILGGPYNGMTQLGHNIGPQYLEQKIISMLLTFKVF